MVTTAVAKTAWVASACARYAISDEKSLADSEIRWPDGARCWVAVTVDLSVASGAEGITAADLATPEALFGANHGLAASREVLRRHRMRATFAVPAVIAHIHSGLVRSLASEGHEIATHGFRHEDVSELERDEERRRIARTTEVLTESPPQCQITGVSYAARGGTIQPTSAP